MIVTEREVVDFIHEGLRQKKARNGALGLG